MWIGIQRTPRQVYRSVHWKAAEYSIRIFYLLSLLGLRNICREISELWFYATWFIVKLHCNFLKRQINTPMHWMSKLMLISNIALFNNIRPAGQACAKILAITCQLLNNCVHHKKLNSIWNTILVLYLLSLEKNKLITICCIWVWSYIPLNSFLCERKPSLTIYFLSSLFQAFGFTVI